MLTLVIGTMFSLAGCGGGGGDAGSAVGPVASAAGVAVAADVSATAAGATAAAAVEFDGDANPVDPDLGGADINSTEVAAIGAGGGDARIMITAPTIAGAATATSVITDLQVESTSTVAQASVPVTVGQVFAPGHLASGQTLVAKLADGTVMPLQMDVKARHPDGSVRHAILSAVLPKLAAGERLKIELARGGAAAGTAATTPAAVLGAGFASKMEVVIGGVSYSASAEKLLAKGVYTTWLSGPSVSEWHVNAPLVSAAGVEHPHLSARFAIRAYGSNKVRVDVTVENAWAFEAAPQNFIYDAKLTIGTETKYTASALTHYHHARWRKVYWWGAEPGVHVRHNTDYLIASRAVPNYDRSFAFSEKTLASIAAGWTGAKTEPMGSGAAKPYMPTTGGRADIGLLPGWNVTYLLSMDKRAKAVALGTADLAGSWSSHYRDKVTGRPVSVRNFPYMTLLGLPSMTINPVTKKSEAFPLCATTNGCATPYVHDSSHQPGFAYLPYVVTGDYYYLEELQFWGMWNAFSTNPSYREYDKGLVQSGQVRGQGWSMRTYAQAAYITPDADILKSHFEHFVTSNLDWYNKLYTNNASANKLGVLAHGYAIDSLGGTAVKPWMDDFFTQSIGHTVELGYAKAKPLVTWKAKFPVLRMTAENACWIDGAQYQIRVRAADNGVVFDTMGEAYKASHDSTINSLACASAEMAAAMGLKIGEMGGYSKAVTGYPSNMQPALAYGVDNGTPNATKAWSVFIARSVKPDYSLGAQFAILPR